MLRLPGSFLRANCLLEPSCSYAIQCVSFSELSSLFVSSPPVSSQTARTGLDYQEKCQNSKRQPDINFVVEKVRVGKSYDEILKSLLDDQECKNIELSHNLVEKLLYRFKDDWKSALGVFRWAESCSGYRHAQEAYDAMVDILGKMKQMDKMWALLEEMGRGDHVTLKTVAKAMRRFAGAGQWEDAVRIFDNLDAFGLKKNTESMNLLLDTLCKEHKVEQARAIFLDLKSHISPDANTFNIFIHGWCKVNRDDEAYWTIHEMKGYGFQPCVISYSTIVQYYCHKSNLGKVYEVFDEMRAQGCPPNVITYTTVMSSLAKSEEFEEALNVAQKMKSDGCKPDTLFYNCLIHTLGRAGRLKEAVHVFDVEMPSIGARPNTSTYNSMIAMFCHHGEELKALNLLKTMRCEPDCQTYYPLLKHCLRTGKIDGLLSELLDDMLKKHHLSLDLSTYTLLIHGLCRANKCKWAYKLFEELTAQDIKPRYRTCHLLLEEVQQNYMYDAADKIETIMKNL